MKKVRCLAYFNKALMPLVYYFLVLTVSFHGALSLFGFFLFLVVGNQLLSGTMLAFSLVTEPMLVPVCRDEEDIENMYTDDFFWLHERGVDLLFIFLFFHLLRKLYLGVFNYEQENAWKSGAFLFLAMQFVVFLGLVLCVTHLSEITLVIAANAFQTFFFFVGKVYCWFFTDRFLNTDTLIRLAYLHYVVAFVVSYFGVGHGIDMHYDWKDEGSLDGLRQELLWWDEAFANELGKTIDILLVIGLCCVFLYTEPEALSYEIFMWGDVGMSVDVRFYGVAPHWYFRPYMAWLIACPYHKAGIFGLVLFFVIVFFQPNVHGYSEFGRYQTYLSLGNIFTWTLSLKYLFKPSRVGVEYTVIYQFFYGLFFMALAYATSFLPYGRFYNQVGGNAGALVAYFFIFFYMGSTTFKNSFFFNLFKTFDYYKLSH